MSLNEPCYEEFSPWLREAFSKADFEDLREGYLELEPSQQHSRIDRIISDPSFSCEQRLSILRDSFYELYLNHSQASQDDSYTFRGNLRAYQKLWQCARCSPDLMNLLFFRRINAPCPLDLLVPSTPTIPSPPRKAEDELKTVSAALNALPETIQGKLDQEGITPQIFGQATPEDLRWALNSMLDLSAGEKLQLIKIHRDLIHSK